MIEARHGAMGLGTWLLVLWLCGACSKTNGQGESPTRYGPDVVVAFEDIVITRDEVEAGLQYVFGVNRMLGQAAARRTVLVRFLMPLKLAQKDHEALRVPRREAAEALVRVVGNGGPPELAAKGRVFGAQNPEEGFSRSEIPLGLAMRVFDETRLGEVELTELPEGFAVVAVSAVIPGNSKPFDRSEAVVVPFFTHTEASFHDWLGSRILGLRGKLDHVAPDYRDVLQEFL